MSRIGRQPVEVPQTVKVDLHQDTLTVLGPKGELKLTVKPEIELKLEGNQVKLARRKNSKIAKSLHGLYRTLIANMVEGVLKGWQKTLKLVGTGYRVNLEGNKLVLSLGFSHPVIVEPVEGIDFEVQGNDTIVVSGIDKALVGQIAAGIRKIKPPEPYKGKGIRYFDEVVHRKPGKAAKMGAAFGAAE